MDTTQEDFSQSPFFKDIDFSNLPPPPYDIPRPTNLPDQPRNKEDRRSVPAQHEAVR